MKICLPSAESYKPLCLAVKTRSSTLLFWLCCKLQGTLSEKKKYAIKLPAQAAEGKASHCSRRAFCAAYVACLPEH